MAIESIQYEKGWGVFFDVRCDGQLYRFSISAETLAAPSLRHRSKRSFPEVFEANSSTFLRAAELLVRTGRLQSGVDIGGTEILASHLAELSEPTNVNDLGAA